MSGATAIPALTALRTAVDALLATTSREGERDAIARVSSASSGPVPPPVENSIRRYLRRWAETAEIGSVTVPIIDLPGVRASVLKEGAAIVATIDAAIRTAEARAEEAATERRRRLAFLRQLRTREETNELMAAFETLQRLCGPAFDGTAGWPHSRLAPLRHSLENALKAVLLWSADRGQPYLLDGGYIHELDALRQEWKAAQPGGI